MNKQYMQYVCNRIIFTIIIWLIIFVPTINAQVINGDFEDGVTGWTFISRAGVLDECPRSGVYSSCFWYFGGTVGSGGSMSQDMDLTGIDYIQYYAKVRLVDSNPGYIIRTIKIDGNISHYIPLPSTNYQKYTADVSNYSGIKTVTFDLEWTYSSQNGITYIDDITLCTMSPMIYNFKDECGNMLKSGYTNIEINNTVQNIHNYNTNPVSFHNDYFNVTDALIITSTNVLSSVQWNKYPSYGGSEDLTDNSIDWNLEITVRDQIDNTIIPNVKVDMNFGCRCNSATSTKTQYSNAYGKTTFGDMANQNVDYTLTRAGYTTTASTIGIDFSPQSENYVATLYMTATEPEDPDPEDPDPEPEENTSIYFTNMSNVIMNIFNNDDVSQFKLWCRNKNHTDATLTFEYYNESTSSYEVVDTWILPAYAYNSYTIPSENFTRTGVYKGKLVTDVTDTEMISVTDNTLFFDLKIYTYINGTSADLNTTNLNINGDIESTGADNYYTDYVAEGDYEIYAYKDGYITTTPTIITIDGSSQTVLIYLDPEIEYYSFTIDVFDTNNVALSYSTVYLEGYSSKDTGSNNFATYTGLLQGDYRYKASKLGYFAVAWINTSIMANDISETVVLTETTFTSSITITDDGRTGKVNESTDHEVDIFIDSNNDSKYNTTVVFYKESIEKANITITKINFTTNHFIWNPDIYHYSDGSDYYAKLYDENDYMLCEDTVYCDDPAVSVYNFTVEVFTAGGEILNGATVYLSGEGSCGCGTTNYCMFDDLEPDTYSYYVTKTGYEDSTPADVTISTQDLTTNVYLTLYVEPDTYDLTINVYNATGTALTNSIVYLSGKTAINTGSTNYGVYSGLLGGTYQYKASKAGYITSTLSDVIITTSDKSVDINLVLQSESDPYTTTKMSDQEIKNLYLPFMYFILIALIIGAFSMMMSGKFK